MIVERLPVDSNPPWDCIHANETCPFCKGEKKADHGVSGSNVWLAVKTAYGEHEYVATLTIFGKDVLPVTREWWEKRGSLDGDVADRVLNHHMGADVSLHRKDLSPSARECQWLGSCVVVASSAMNAMDMFNEFGETDWRKDPKEQPEALWRALEAWLRAEVEREEAFS